MNIYRIFRKKNFPIKTFVLLSITCLFLLIFLYSFFIMIFWQSNTDNVKKTATTADQYYLNNQFDEKDPLITSVPNLKDMIRGPIISSNDPSLGNADAQIKIIEFSDYQCQFCQKQEVIIRDVVEEYGDKIRLIWKDLPEENVGSISFRSAIAGRCAFEQDKFWEYHDLLFKEKDLNENKFINLAEKLKLNKDSFKTCLKDNNIIRSINDNLAEAGALNITGVPFIYVNDQEVMGEITKENLKQLIDIELNKQ